MEIPVRMNTTRPVSLCSLWGQGKLARAWESPRGTQAEDPSQTPLQTLVALARSEKPVDTQGQGTSIGGSQASPSIQGHTCSLFLSLFFYFVAKLAIFTLG